MALPTNATSEASAVPSAAGSFLAMRRQPRFVFQRHGWARLLESPEACHNIVTQDISTLGVGLLAVHPFPVGSRLAVTITFDGGEKRKILCCVRRCQQLSHGFYDVGAEFEASMVDQTGDDPIPAEWMEWAQDAANRAANPEGRPVLDATLIPGSFSEPLPAI